MISKSINSCNHGSLGILAPLQRIVQASPAAVNVLHQAGNHNPDWQCYSGQMLEKLSKASLDQPQLLSLGNLIYLS